MRTHQFSQQDVFHPFQAPIHVTAPAKNIHHSGRALFVAPVVVASMALGALLGWGAHSGVDSAAARTPNITLSAPAPTARPLVPSPAAARITAGALLPVIGPVGP
jgi:hypothetical protein